MNSTKYSTSERVSDAAEETEAHPELRGVDTNTGAIAQFVNVVGDVHDIEPGLEPFLAADLEALFHADAHGIVGRHCAAVGNGRAIRRRGIGAQSASVERIHIEAGAAIVAFPKVGRTKGTGDKLIVVEVNPVVANVIKVGLAKEDLAGNHVATLGDGIGYVGISRETALHIVCGKLNAIDFAFAIIELGEDEGLAKKTVIELVFGALVVAIHADLKAGKQFMGDAGIEIIGTLGSRGASLLDFGFIRCAIEFGHRG